MEIFIVKQNRKNLFVSSVNKLEIHRLGYV